MSRLKYKNITIDIKDNPDKQVNFFLGVLSIQSVDLEFFNSSYI